MSTEYKLPYTGNEIEEKLEKIDILATKSEIPTKVSQLQNDAGYLTEHQDISGKLDAPATAKVGQAIIVKAVDEKSIPTECEAADFPSDSHINTLIDAKLGVIENGTY